MSLPWYWTPLLLASLLVVTQVIARRLNRHTTGRPLPIPVQTPPFEPDPLAPAHLVLASFWARGGGYPAPCPRGEQAVRDIEQRYGIVLPEDFRAYLLTAAPAEDYWDDNDGIWWAPKNIRSIAEEYAYAVRDPGIAARSKGCLFFADYCAWFWAWAICCEQGAEYGKIALIGGEDRWVADSFSDFVRSYTRDPMSVS